MFKFFVYPPNCIIITPNRNSSALDLTHLPSLLTLQQPLIYFLALWMCLFQTFPAGWLILLNRVPVSVLHSSSRLSNSPMLAQSHQIYPFISCWIFGLFPLWDSNDQCYSEYSCAYFCLFCFLCEHAFSSPGGIVGPSG